MKLLHTMLKWATTVRVRKGHRLLESNPLQGVRRPRERNPKRPVATLGRFRETREAIQVLIAEASTDAERRKWRLLELALVLAEATGRRLGSIRQLAWSDVDMTRGQIRWAAENDKQGREWVVPVPRSLIEELQSFRVEIGGDFGSLVFPSESDPSVPVRADVFSKWLLAAEEKAELPKLNGSLWHAYRRGWATARKNLPISDVAFAGGWSDATTLLRCYQQPDEATLLRVMSEPRNVLEEGLERDSPLTGANSRRLKAEKTPWVTQAAEGKEVLDAAGKTQTRGVSSQRHPLTNHYRLPLPRGGTEHR